MKFDCEYIIQEEETQVNGVVAILNAEGLGWEHVKAYDSNMSKIFIKVMQVHSVFIFLCICTTDLNIHVTVSCKNKKQ